jgi:hypothetical protein
VAVILKREHRRSLYSVIVKAPDGTPITRWAQDEPRLENVFSGLTFGGEMPGGHKELSLRLPRDPKQSYRDLALFNIIEVLSSSGDRVWSGTIRQEPTSDGDQQSIEVKAAGDMQFLEDDPTVIGPGFISVDQSKWVGPSAQRKINVGSTYDQSPSPSIDTDPGGNSRISITSTGKLNHPVWMAMFDAGAGIRIETITGVVEPVNLAPHSSEPFTEAHMYEADDDVFTNFVALGDLSAGGGFSYAVADRRVVAFQGLYSFVEPGGTEGTEYGYRLGDLIVLGANGLTLHGEWPNVGYFAEQMIPFIAELAGLTTNPELLEDDEFVIPQAWFDTPGTPMSKLVEVTKYGLLDWFVFGDRILQYRKPGTYGRTWRLGPGNGPKNSGADAGQVYDRFMVQWQDVDGTTKKIGIGGSGADFQDNRLLVTDERNPAVAAGRPRGKLIALNGVCTAQLALEVGMRVKEELQNLSQSGEVTLTDHVQDEASGAWYPVGYVQPGDRVREQSNGHERKVTSTSYSDESVSNDLTIGAPPNGEAAIEERFNARLLELGLGG